jgi:hypothetical protein
LCFVDHKLDFHKSELANNVNGHGGYSSSGLATVSPAAEIYDSTAQIGFVTTV